MKRLVTEECDDEAIRNRQELSEDTENQQDEGHALDDGSDDDLTDDEDSDESYDALEDRFHGLEEEVATLVADVHDLALHTKLNITGFMKILKVSVWYICNLPILPFFTYQKHDVRRTYNLCITFNILYRNKPA